MQFLSKTGFAAILALLMGHLSSAANLHDDKSAQEQRRYLFLLDEKDRLAVRQDAMVHLARLDVAVNNPAALATFFDESDCMRRQGIKKSRFVEAVQRMRAIAKVPTSRSLDAVSGGFRRLPSSPDESRYAIAVFDSTYADLKVFQTEQVTLEWSSKSGHWNFCGYYLGVKPYYVY